MSRTAMVLVDLQVIIHSSVFHSVIYNLLHSAISFLASICFPACKILFASRVLMSLPFVLVSLYISILASNIITHFLTCQKSVFTLNSSSLSSFHIQLFSKSDCYILNLSRMHTHQYYFRSGTYYLSLEPLYKPPGE